MHIPKCAGTSIEKALIPVVSRHANFDTLDEEETGKFWLPGPQQLQHRKLVDYQQQFPLDEYFKFTFVRNPWDRAISQILHFQRRRNSLFAGDDFKKLVATYCSTTAMIASQDLGACQVDYLFDRAGECRMDFVGRFESLSTDFSQMTTRLGLDKILHLPHIFNSRRTRPYQNYYDEESAELVRRRFAPDIAAFGYQFAAPEGSVSA